jgi:hypothetical protein
MHVSPAKHGFPAQASTPESTSAAGDRSVESASGDLSERSEPHPSDSMQMAAIKRFEYTRPPHDGRDAYLARPHHTKSLPETYRVRRSHDSPKLGLQSANLRVAAALLPGSKRCAVPPIGSASFLASLGQSPDCLQVGRPASSCPTACRSGDQQAVARLLAGRATSKRKLSGSGSFTRFPGRRLGLGALAALDRQGDPR